MVKTRIVMVLFLLGLIAGHMGAAAQGTGAAKTPDLDADDKVTVTLLATLDRRWQGDCRNGDSYKEFATARQRVAARLEVKYPGFTLNGANAGLTLVEAKSK